MLGRHSIEYVRCERHAFELRLIRSEQVRQCEQDVVVSSSSREAVSRIVEECRAVPTVLAVRMPVVHGRSSERSALTPSKFTAQIFSLIPPQKFPVIPKEFPVMAFEIPCYFRARAIAGIR